MEFSLKSSIILGVLVRDAHLRYLSKSDNRVYPHLHLGRFYFQNFNVIAGIPFLSCGILEFRIQFEKKLRQRDREAGMLQLYRDRANNQSHRITSDNIRWISNERNINKCAPRVTDQVNKPMSLASDFGLHARGDWEPGLTETCTIFHGANFSSEERRKSSRLVGLHFRHALR